MPKKETLPIFKDNDHTLMVYKNGIHNAGAAWEPSSGGTFKQLQVLPAAMIAFYQMEPESR